MRILGVLSVGAVIGFSLALPARGDNMLQLSQPVINTLTPIDSLPSSQQIDTVFNDDHSVALTNLQAIANPTGSVDRGVQIRAVRALIHYCATTPCGDLDPAHATLVAIATNPIYRDSRSGSDLLVLRATIESLGVLQVPGDMQKIADQLQHPSRDIRATAARALRDLGNTQAIPFLRARYNVEPPGPAGDQVRIAISDALRVLGMPL